MGLKTCLLFFIWIAQVTLTGGASPATGMWAVKYKDESIDRNVEQKQDRSEVARRDLEGVGLSFVEELPFKNTFLAQHLSENGKRRSEDEIRRLLDQNPEIEWAEFQFPRILEKRSYPFSDPLFPSQWFLEDIYRLQDTRVTLVWAQGINGTGVNVAVVDDGLDYTHKDLVQNYNPKGSYDFIAQTPDPSPKNVNETHGTRSGAEVVAAPNNSYCGVGIAFGSQVSGIRILGDSVADADIAKALSYQPDINSIYLANWGPTDNGTELQGPGPLTLNAMQETATKGRGGLGSLYVFAVGNGGLLGDDCNFDGYANSIYSIAVGGITNSLVQAPFSESCAAMLVVSFSSGGSTSIATSDVGNTCTTDFEGTSSAASLVAGMAALALSIRPDLTARDIQHLFVRSTDVVQSTDPDWAVNAAGFNINHKYGFGNLKADKLVANAKTWTSVGPLYTYTTATQNSNLVLAKNGIRNLLAIEIQQSPDLPKSVERVAITVTIDHPQRGLLSIQLISPGGTVSNIAPRRYLDKSPDGFQSWTFTTVRNWGEDPQGVWVISIVDASSITLPTGTLRWWKMTIYGSDADYQQDTYLALKIGIPIGVGVFLLLVIWAGWCLWRRRKMLKRRFLRTRVELRSGYDEEHDEDEDATEMS